MSDLKESGNDVEVDLVSEGIVSYLDARYAIEMFENEIGEIAQGVLVSSLTNLKKIPNFKKLSEQEIAKFKEDNLEAIRGRVGVGATTWIYEEGIRLGIGWNTSEIKGGMDPIACFAVRFSAQYKTDNIFDVFQDNFAQMESTTVFIRKTGWPYEVQFWKTLEQNASADCIRTALVDVFSAFLQVSIATGNLDKVVYPK